MPVQSGILEPADFVLDYSDRKLFTGFTTAAFIA